MFRPKISVITVTYNVAPDLEKTVCSVSGQTYPNVEYIVVDGGSTDGSDEVVRKYSNVVDWYVSEADNGIYDAMNKGLEAATGDYVQFLNAGDYYFDNDSLAQIISAAGTPFDLIYGDIQLVQVDGKQQHHKAKGFTLDALKHDGTGVLCHQAMLVRRLIAPRYSIRYTYKGELNWYFDIIESNPRLSWFHNEIPFVHYVLGGTGYRNFMRNRLEWYSLLYRRYGAKSVFNRRFLERAYNDYRFRYPAVRWLHGVFSRFVR